MGESRRDPSYLRNKAQVDKLAPGGLEQLKRIAHTYPPIVVLMTYMRLTGADQGKIGQLTGMSQSTVSLWLEGSRMPNPAARQALEAVCWIPAGNWDKSWKAA
jgi:transcriptional regulator with XRE-family HTH domain